MRDRHNFDLLIDDSVHNSIWKAPEQEASRSVNVNRPSARRFDDLLNCVIEFPNKSIATATLRS